MAWNSIDEMFRELHRRDIKYIILRNFEEIDDDRFYTPGHADIDILTANGKKLAKCIHAVPRFIKDDGIHYKVLIGGTEVIIDTRSVGDGYYDKNWEKTLLSDRVLKNNRFYCPNDSNYYYSLVYHSVLHKKALSDEYLQRLNNMAKLLGIHAYAEKDHLSELESFMQRMNYCYTLPYDIHVLLRKELVPTNRIKKQIKVVGRDCIYKALQFGSNVKHYLLHK